MKVGQHVEKLLRQGRKPSELIELGFPKSVVTRVRRELRKEKGVLKGIVPEGAAEAESHLQGPVDLLEKIAVIEGKQESLANCLQKVDTLRETLSEVAGLIAVARYLGSSKRATCLWEQDGLCMAKTWASQEEIPPGIGEPATRGDEKPEWYLNPSPFYCALCTALLGGRMGYIEDEVSADPLSGASNEVTCDGCGSKGFIAVAIKCTKCGHQTDWGWFPEE